MTTITKQSFKTQGASYSLRVSPYLKDGANALTISPTSSTLTITELRVELK